MHLGVAGLIIRCGRGKYYDVAHVGIYRFGTLVVYWACYKGVEKKKGKLEIVGYFNIYICQATNQSPKAPLMDKQYLKH
jgi:hypothetical protein